MLREHAIQFADSGKDHWFARLFTDPDHLLCIFYNRQREIIRWHFDDRSDPDRFTSLACVAGCGVQYHVIDAGESLPTANRTPVVSAAAPFDADAFRQHFSEVAADIDPKLIRIVLDSIDSFPHPAKK